MIRLVIARPEQIRSCGVGLMHYWNHTMAQAAKVAYDFLTSLHLRCKMDSLQFQEFMSRKVAFTVQKSQRTVKVTKPESVNMNINWNPNVPKIGAVTRRGATVLVDPVDDEFARLLENESNFDSIMDIILNTSPPQVLEPRLKALFGAQTCVVWIDEPTKGTLHSPTYDLQLDYSDSIIGVVKTTRSVMQVQNERDSKPGYVCTPKIGDIDSKHLFFPLVCSGVVKLVIQVVRAWNQADYGEADLELVAFLMRKFELYGDSLFRFAECKDITIKLFEGGSIRTQFSLLQSLFHCRAVELWRCEKSGNQYQQWNLKEKHFCDVKSDKPGIAGYVLSKCKAVNEKLSSNNEHFVVEFDGGFDGPVLAVPFSTARTNWCLVLRNKETSFSGYDELVASSLLPFLAHSLSDEGACEDISPLLTNLLDIATLMTQTLDLDELVHLLQNESAKLIGCEKAKLVMIDHEQRELVSHVESDKGQRHPLGTGLAGASIETKQIISVQTPEGDNRFVRSIDSDGIETVESVMSAPVFDVNKQVIGALVLINKSGGAKFEVSDENVISFFNLFAGIAIDNTLRYCTNFTLSEMFSKWTNVETVAVNGEQAKTEMAQLLNRVMYANRCDRITMFCFNGEYTECVSVGAALRGGTRFASEAGDKGEPIHFSSRVIASKLQAVPNAPAPAGKRLSRAKANTRSRLFRGPVDTVKDNDTDNIYCVPMTNEDGAIFGVLEFQFSYFPTAVDLDSFQKITKLVSCSLQRIELQEFTDYGYGKIELNNWITPEELESREPPKKLALNERRAISAFKREFSLDHWGGIGCFQLVFHLFHKHGLMEEFGFNNGHLFSFLSELKSAYGVSPFCNWGHAIDTMQFAGVVVSCVKLADTFSKIELFALFVACLAHDVGHDGFSEISETYHNQLMRRHATFEADSCIRTIQILMKEECNIFVGMSDEQTQLIWEIIIDLITATDMAQHFVVLGKIQDLMGSGEFNPRKDEAHKRLLLQLIIKCADLSRVARSPESAKVCVCSAEEFYRQGDLDKVPDLVYTATDKRRESIDKQGSFPVFVGQVCVPMFDALVKFCPSLDWITSLCTKRLP